MKNRVIYFDMDGVLADWVDGYNNVKNLPNLSIFSSLSKDEKHKIKQTFIGYDFFINLKPIQKGLDLFDTLSKDNDCRILSAVGNVNSLEVQQAKEDWIVTILGPDVKTKFVTKVFEKSNVVDSNECPILIDDRVDAIEAWESAGFTGILFKE